VGQVGDRLLGGERARLVADEVVGQPVEVDVDQRVELERVLEHDARLPQVVAVHQRVHEQERVAGAGMPGQHHHGVLRPGDAVVQG
jgi:hypothetical protein